MENLKTYEGFLSSLSYGIKKAVGSNKPDDDIADRILTYLKNHPFTDVRHYVKDGFLRLYVDYTFDIDQDKKSDGDPFGEEVSKNSIIISAHQENVNNYIGRKQIYLNGEKIECSYGMAESIYDKMRNNYNTKTAREEKESRRIKEEARRKKMEDIKKNLKF